MAEALPKQLGYGTASVATGEDEEVAGHVENLDEASKNGANGTEATVKKMKPGEVTGAASPCHDCFQKYL